QFVDRVGSMLVRSSFRPFYRLVLFGGLFLMTQLAIELTRSSLLNPVQQFLNRFVGPTVMVLGTICFFILVLGWWLKRIAREATEFYERSVEAQFLSLTEIVRGRHLRRDAQIVFDRVIRPEWELTGSRDGQALTEKASRFYNCVRQSLVEAASADEDGAWLRGVETTLLLYRDWLDGGILTDNDTRTTSQLLGSPAVRQFLGNSRRIDRRQIKSLQTLDLVRQKSLFGGPYLWFNFIARSVAHSVANLLVDYNQYVIPLDELPHVSSDVRTAYDRWLAEGDGTAAEPADDLALGVAERDYITTAFTALHFLDFDEARDRQVELRFGPRVLKRLRIDRSLMIRRIFGTYPMHDRPKEQRVVNLYALYRNWIAGGRAFLLPLYAFLAGWKFLWTLLVWVWRAVQQIRRPELRASNRDAARAHFFAAVRKIGRVRGPIVFASMRLRMMLDPEYLGLTLPTLSPPLPKGEPGGITSSPPLPKGGPGGVAGFSTPTTDLESDLAFLDPPPDFLDEVERERNRAAGDMRRLEEALEQGLLRQAAEERGLAPDALSTPEHIRAAAVVWLGDYRGVRSHLAAEAVLAEVSRRAAGQPLLPGRWLPRPRLKRSFRRWWAANGFGEKAAAKAAWRAVLNNVGGSRTALVALDRHGTNVADVGRQMLGEILLHPGRITEQLVTLRAIQTLAVLDVLNYREHIYHLGRYADMGDEPGELLTWATAGCRSAAQAIGFAPDPAAAPSHGAA
ncbi:MAG: hypothetical protein KY476_22875, partial [Planctomycetes bacterium]|nr:hypothetical protein [Planctomycetota bacterium]